MSADGRTEGQAPLRLYFVRHAETHNPRDILYGRLPRFDLSERGRQQAVALADAMASLRLDAIYQSPLLRARRTAATIAARHPGVPVKWSKLLLENLHPYQGRPQSEIAKIGDRAYDPEILGAGGESIADLRRRMARFVQVVRARHPGGVLAVVSHADPLSALRLNLLGKESTHANLRQEAPPLASIFQVELGADGSSRLEWFWKLPAALVPAQRPADGAARAAAEPPGAASRDGAEPGPSREPTP
jgi:broad specificity phosphatase PhoE